MCTEAKRHNTSVMKANFIEIVSFIVFAFLTLDKSVRVFALFGNKKTPTKAYTNDVVKIVNGIKHKRLGGEGEIVVSEVGLGTQRWVSEDFNAPDESLCHSFLDKATSSGINLVDTAEQYPIPSSSSKPEGLTETIIGNWVAKSKGNREKLVIASKITGSRNVCRANIFKDCENSLKRLQTDYLDVYLLHWPARYSPQSII